MEYETKAEAKTKTAGVYEDRATVSTPTMLPKAFQLIDECHNLIDEVESKTDMLLVPEMSTKGEEDSGPSSPLELRLEVLRDRLGSLSNRYSI